MRLVNDAAPDAPVFDEKGQLANDVFCIGCGGGAVFLGTIVPGQVSIAQMVVGLLALSGFMMLVPTQIWPAVLCFKLSARLVKASRPPTRGQGSGLR